LGYGIPEYLHFVSVDFEAGLSWWELLKNAGFNTGQPTVIACTGVSMYLTKDAILATLRQIAKLAPGSKVAMTFMLPLELIETEDRSMQEMSEKGARASGTPFISFFSPEEMSTLAIEAGFKKVQSVLAKNLAERYFAGRSDNLYPASGEAFLIGTT